MPFHKNITIYRIYHCIYSYSFRKRRASWDVQESKVTAPFGEANSRLQGNTGIPNGLSLSFYPWLEYWAHPLNPSSKMPSLSATSLLSPGQRIQPWTSEGTFTSSFCSWMKSASPLTSVPSILHVNVNSTHRDTTKLNIQHANVPPNLIPSPSRLKDTTRDLLNKKTCLGNTRDLAYWLTACRPSLSGDWGY